VNLVLPATLHVQCPVTEGMPHHRGQDKPRAQPTKDRPEPMRKEVCTNWNHRAGQCAADGPCPSGRLHKCSRCGKQHRACDFHDPAPRKDVKGKTKGNGKGDKGKKRGQTPQDAVHAS